MATGDWSAQSPYKVIDNQEFGEVQWTGQCHCTRVSYQINRQQPLDSKFCHCRDCQVKHGAPFQWAAIFHKSDMRILQGHEHISFYNELGNHHHLLPCKVTCSYCKTPILDEGRNMILIFPELIKHFGQDARFAKMFAVNCHIFYSQRVIDIPDGRPKWIGLDKKSEAVRQVE